MWMSHQKFEGENLDDMFSYIAENQPDWFGGLVYGPWTKISLAETRERLDPKYGIRSPTLTSPIPSGASFRFTTGIPAYMQTEGREPINPTTGCDADDPQHVCSTYCRELSPTPMESTTTSTRSSGRRWPGIPNADSDRDSWFTTGTIS